MTRWCSRHADISVTLQGQLGTIAGKKLRQERNVYSLIAKVRAKLRRSGMFEVPDSFDWLEKITLIVWNVMPLQKFNIFVLERLSMMMRLLIANVVGHTIQM